MDKSLSSEKESFSKGYLSQSELELKLSRLLKMHTSGMGQLRSGDRCLAFVDI